MIKQKLESLYAKGKAKRIEILIKLERPDLHPIIYKTKPKPNEPFDLHSHSILLEDGSEQSLSDHKAEKRQERADKKEEAGLMLANLSNKSEAEIDERYETALSNFLEEAERKNRSRTASQRHKENWVKSIESELNKYEHLKEGLIPDEALEQATKLTELTNQLAIRIPISPIANLANQLAIQIPKSPIIEGAIEISSALNKYQNSQEYQTISKSIAGIAKSINQFSNTPEFKNLMQGISSISKFNEEHKATFLQISEGLRAQRVFEKNSRSQGKTLEWVSGEILEVEPEASTPHPDYEQLRSANYPQFSIRDLAILRHPLCRNERLEFQALLITLVRNGLLKSSGNFLNPGEPKYHVINKNHYLSCEYLIENADHQIEEWFGMPSLNQNEFKWDESLNKGENRGLAVQHYLAVNNLPEDHTPETSLEKLWDKLKNEDYLDHKDRNIFSPISAGEIYKFFTKHTKIDPKPGRK